MLRIVLMSLALAICSTCLVRPWFWKRVKNKYFFNDDGKPGFDRHGLKSDIAIQMACFVIVLCASMFVYAGGAGQNLYSSFLMIMLCFLMQCLWDNQSKWQYVIMLIVAALSAILWIQDGIASFNINIPLNRVDSVSLITTKADEDTEVKLLVSSNEIQSLFKVTSASGPTYNNGKYIYTVSGGDNGLGIVTIDKDNYTEANFLSCSYGLDVIYIRSEYPTYKLEKLYITISDDNVPYGLFAIADKTGLLGTYNVNRYLLLNLVTGETQEFKTEQLPSFVTRN